MKILTYFKKNAVFISFALIFILAFILRILFINRPDGLWYDELVIYNEISKPSLWAVIVDTIKIDIHFPLYNSLLYLWSKIFSTFDVALKFLSVVFSMATVVVSFFIGKNIKNSFLGIITMFIFAINSYQIYYSQEVKMYSLLYLLLCLNFLYLVKIIKNSEKLKYFIVFSIFSYLVLITYTSALVFIFVEYFLLSLYFYFYSKKAIKNFNLSLLTLFILNIPTFFIYLYNIDKFKSFHTSVYSDYSSLLVAFQNYLTPVFFAQATNPPHYFRTLISNLSLINVVFVILPLMISAYFLYRGLKLKDKSITVLASLISLFLISAVLAFKFSNFPLLSRYLSFILPLLLVCLSFGIESCIAKSNFSRALFVAFILINLSYLVFSNNSVYKISRCGYKPLANYVNEFASNGDVLVVWNNPNIIDKYLENDLQKLVLLKNFAYTSDEILYNEDKLNKMKLDERKEFLREALISKEIPSNNILLLNTIQHHFKGKNFILTTTQNFDDFDRNSFIDLVNDEQKLKEMPYNSLLTIYAVLNIKDFCNQNFKLINQKKDGYFVVYVYQM